MITIENTKIVGFEDAIRGMRNPWDSWEKSDSKNVDDLFVVGSDDEILMKKLSKAGPVHGKFLRMITVYCDITAPLYWWKEFDTYKVGTVSNSCSTMHTITNKEFTLSDFSTDMITNKISKDSLNNTIETLNTLRNMYMDIKSSTFPNKSQQDVALKDIWYDIIQILPSSYNQKRTIMLNYEVLRNIYTYRRGHRLKEWLDFIDWIKTLDLSEIITISADKR